MAMSVMPRMIAAIADPQHQERGGPPGIAHRPERDGHLQDA